jgi:hypothetical protein
VTSSGTAAGFAGSGTGVTYSYACGSVSGGACYGFMTQGSASNCYTISALPAGGIGFAPTGTTLSACYWIQDSGKNFNTGLSTSSSAGIAATFYALSKLSWITTSTAYPFDTGNGTTYYYTVSGVVHNGNWTSNPAPRPQRIDRRGQIVRSAAPDTPGPLRRTIPPPAAPAQTARTSPFRPIRRATISMSPPP